MTQIGNNAAVDVNSLFYGAQGGSTLPTTGVGSEFVTTGGDVTIAPKAAPNSFFGSVLDIAKVAIDVFKEAKPVLTTVKPEIVSPQPMGNNVFAIPSANAAQGVITNSGNSAQTNSAGTQATQQSKNFFGNIDWLSIGLIGAVAVGLVLLARGKK